MAKPDGPIEELLGSLQERAKELDCLYQVDEVLHREGIATGEALHELAALVSGGWQHTDVCRARITYGRHAYALPDFQETPWVLKAELRVRGEPVGEVAVHYLEPRPAADDGPFLKAERRLLNTLANQIGAFLTQRQLRRAFSMWDYDEGFRQTGHEWSAIVDFLRLVDSALLTRLTRRLINDLCWHGAPEAEELLERFGTAGRVGDGGDNQPMARTSGPDMDRLTDDAFSMATLHRSDSELVASLKRWITEDRSSFVIRTLENPNAPLPEIASTLGRFAALDVDEADLPLAVQTSLRVSLLRRIVSERVDYINVAKHFVRVQDFVDLVPRLVAGRSSSGRVGGKGAGLFLASLVIREATAYADQLDGIRIPKTWYVTSDGLRDFVRGNQLEDVIARKYEDLEEVRLQHPQLVQVFKRSPLPTDLRRGLSLALDDLGERPLVVRSSSLLEDATGAVFSGKYKSLFLANQGTKRERMEALEDAIAEVYASVFGPDPIEYRAERGLLDVHEEMGVMLQEVVGERVGRYFLPAFAGVAFSSNELRWSPRIRREDGLIRLVPGLGTRAVDRLADDYPVLVAPGQPGLRVNATLDEVVRYAPRYADVINLETNAFETVEIAALLREVGDSYPLIHRLVSLLDGDQLKKPLGAMLDLESGTHVVTFEGLLSDTSFVPRMRVLLKVLQQKLGTPVDLEFAADGEALYLLQCRPQSSAAAAHAATIPRRVPKDRLLFSANRYVSNGRVPDLTHVVYVDPARYAALPDAASLREVGRAVGRVNHLLPRRQFALLGPGRWGSRGDIHLGVPVTYADIRNTALLVEIARKQGNYVPDLSFGTHFFQDLVEAGIRYLPLYPDDPEVVFAEAFFLQSDNLLPDLAPELAHLADVLRVIDVPRAAGGRILRVLMNGDIGEAVGILAEPGRVESRVEPLMAPSAADAPAAVHSVWRLAMAARIAEELDGARFGVRALYVFGSARNGAAEAGSDLDLIVHLEGGEDAREALRLWLDGWSLCLSEANFLRTGRRTDGLLDVHFVTREDIERKMSYAAKIEGTTDAARLLRTWEA